MGRLPSWLARDKLAPNLVMGDGFRAALLELLGGRMRPPHRSTIERASDELKVEHDTRLMSRLQKLVVYEHPMAAVQVDIW